MRSVVMIHGTVQPAQATRTATTIPMGEYDLSLPLSAGCPNEEIMSDYQWDLTNLTPGRLGGDGDGERARVEQSCLQLSFPPHLFD